MSLSLRTIQVGDLVSIKDGTYGGYIGRVTHVSSDHVTVIVAEDPYTQVSDWDYMGIIYNLNQVEVVYES